MVHPKSNTLRTPNFDHPAWIVIEGIDGTGKSTLARELGVALESRGRSVLLTAEPTHEGAGARLRALMQAGRDNVTPEQELALFIEDRKMHLASRVMPALAAGQVVIQDRYFYSTMAYQGTRGLDVDHIRALHAEFAPSPDLLLILELPVDDALDRIRAGRGESPNTFEQREALVSCARIFAGIEHPNCLRLDASLPPHAMVEKVLSHAFS